MPSLRSSSLRKLSTLVRDATEPIFLLDPNGQLSYANPAWELLSGRSAMADQSENNSESDSYAGEVAWPAPPAAVLQGISQSGPVFITTATGETRCKQVEYLPLHESGGSLLGILGILREEPVRSGLVESSELRIRAQLDAARQAARRRFGHATLIGEGLRHDRLMGQIALGAKVRTPVLIVGEPGTGRQLAARSLHEQSPDAHSPFLVCDLNALTADQIEAMLFPAQESTEQATRTIFLKEVSRLPRDLQSRLAAVLSHTHDRIIASTYIDPEAALHDGRLREDFFYAITSLIIRTAPLRDRLAEIPLLAQHFLELVNRQVPSHRAEWTTSALDVLAAYDWPGNLTELLAVTRSAQSSSFDCRITASELPAEIRGELAAAFAPSREPSSITPMDVLLTQVERRLIDKALADAKQNKSRAAELLDISRPRLYRRIKELGIEHDDSDEVIES